MISVKEKYPMLKTPFFKGADAFTLGRTIHYKTYIRRHHPSLFWHEMCHVCQYEKYGIEKFLYIYFVKEFFKSYRKKSFEVEAYSVKTKQDLLKLYPEYKKLIEEGSRVLAKYYSN